MALHMGVRRAARVGPSCRLQFFHNFATRNKEFFCNSPRSDWLAAVAATADWVKLCANVARGEAGTTGTCCGAQGHRRSVKKRLLAQPFHCLRTG